MRGLVVVSMGRAAAEAYVPSGREVCIALHDHRAPPSRLHAGFVDALHLHCSDWQGHPPYPAPPMTAGQASRVLAFVEQHRENVDRIVVHCLHGRSRAPSLAMALRAACGQPVPRGWRPPNPLLYRTVMSARRRRNSHAEGTPHVP